MKNQIEPEIIGLLIQNNDIIIVNPCRVPIEHMEDAIREHRKRKPEKNEVVSYMTIKIPLPKSFKKNAKTNTKTSTRNK